MEKIVLTSAQRDLIRARISKRLIVKGIILILFSIVIMCTIPHLTNNKSNVLLFVTMTVLQIFILISCLFTIITFYRFDTNKLTITYVDANFMIRRWDSQSPLGDPTHYFKESPLTRILLHLE